LADESLEDAQGILEGVPARHLDHQRGRGRNWLVLDHLGSAHHPAGAAIQATKHRLPQLGGRILQNSGGPDDGVDRGCL
jgi:hypothetical protein